MNLIAQENLTGIGQILDSIPSDEIMVMFVVFVVFSSLLTAAVVFFVTNTIRSIKTAAIHSRLTEKLVSEGVPYDQVERLVRANTRRINLPQIKMPGRWKKATVESPVTGKPASLRA